jgi:prophage maintenance system killer protein
MGLRVEVGLPKSLEEKLKEFLILNGYHKDNYSSVIASLIRSYVKNRIDRGDIGFKGWPQETHITLTLDSLDMHFWGCFLSLCGWSISLANDRVVTLIDKLVKGEIMLEQEKENRETSPW